MDLVILLLLLLGSAVFVFSYHCFSQKPIHLLSQAILLLVFLFCLFSPLLMPMPDTWRCEIPVFGDFQFSIILYYDALTWVMLCLVSFISLLIHSYAARYLLSDQNQARFMGQLSLLTFSVMLLMMSGSLFTAFIAWQFIGLSLYLLLNHYHYDVKANKAAKKKFMINRVGDICFLLAVIIAAHQYDTTRFTTLFLHAGHFDHSILLLIFIAIMTKSAQFPFHIWLIDTMEAPTPVSALMHAGVINAGGFLLARLSPLYDQAFYLLVWIFLVGLVTALLGNFFMQNQSDIKKRLAYSTMGQMGYMLMQCGLGCFASAVFHLIAHGFFKATLFLSSGSRLNQVNQPLVEGQGSPANRLTIFWASLVMTLIMVGASFVYFSNANGLIAQNPLLWVFIGISVFQLLYQALRFSKSMLVSILLVFSVAFLFVIYIALLSTFNSLLSGTLAEISLPMLGWSAIAVLLMFALLFFLFYHQCSARVRKAILRKVYLLGFYKGSIERKYRQYGINPMRRLGDFLLNTFQHSSIWLKRLVVIGFLSLSVIAIFYYIIDLPYHAASFQFFFMIANLIFLLMVLLVANRVATLPHFLLTLLLMVFSFTNLACGLGEGRMDLIAIFQWINNILIVAGFSLLLIRRQSCLRFDPLVQNRLPWCHFYMSLLLILLIGIPGTASFITEFYLLGALLQVHIVFALLLGMSLLLLALVVLHVLQLHFFNPKAIMQYAVSLSPGLHMICILIIAFNIFNGLYPSVLLRGLAQVMGR